MAKEEIIFIAIDEETSAVCAARGFPGLSEQTGISVRSLKKFRYDMMEKQVIKGWRIVQVELVKNKPRGKGKSEEKSQTFHVKRFDAGKVLRSDFKEDAGKKAREGYSSFINRVESEFLDENGDEIFNYD